LPAGVSNRQTPQRIRWTAENRTTGLLFLASIAVVFVTFGYLPFIAALGVGGAAAILSCVYSARVLVRLTSLAFLPVQLLDAGCAPRRPLRATLSCKR
jgi:hypothetical protein